MATLHIFNPEHDLALAFGSEYFTPPHAARELRTNMGFLPALWAQDGDLVLVDDVDYAVKASQRFSKQSADVLFLSLDDLKKNSISEHATMTISPWGWDAALCHRLKRAGIPEHLLPSQQQLSEVRSLSSREQSVALLADIRKQRSSSLLVGESCCVHDFSSLLKVVESVGDCVIKAPWSSSGRGVRYLMKNEGPDASLCGWISRVLEQQGQIVVEPFYRKIKDFAMEFQLTEDGRVEYLGLSLFHTQRATYVGNLLATEQYKRAEISKYVPETLLTEVASSIIAWMEKRGKGIYAGPFGVDMMIVGGEKGYQFHPCVELNLRRTMGHVALALTPKPTEPRQVMNIVHDVNYQFRITPAENNFVTVV